ncbi:hypothetical protein [Arthrobacter mobilis]|uniref:Uncharacterized protein n=1 Tax=Arthrobacter mobilis TaxID=2724944 RepID=A0A7X6K4Z6_9MICC|nr:hypothetical protein [Arthrobacter mobilis]NKX55180.1 hypothetical protein [Arthrobacter mobilis]
MEEVSRDVAGRLDGTDAGSRAAKAILDRLEALAPFCARDADTDDIEPDSPLAWLDARFASLHGVSGLLKQSLSAAMDNTQALRRLLFVEEPSGRIFYRLNTHAPYSLVRTIIECGSTVLWALLPDEGRESARRSLVLIAREVFNAASFWGTYLEEFHPVRHGQALEYFDGLRRAVNDSAEALQLPPVFSQKAGGSWGYATKNRTQTAILKDLHGQVAPELIYVWQFCSGYSHGLEWASANGSIYPDPFAEPGREHLPAGSMEQLRRVCDVAFDLVPQAWAIYDIRRRAWPLL